uniref:Uncharacterized protein n=1 Tax=Ditylenchus dipsaci TaxID=166011 RepID=A0A915DFA0_9BILA
MKNQRAMNQRFGEEEQKTIEEITLHYRLFLEFIKTNLSIGATTQAKKARVSITKFVNARADAESYREISIDAQSKFNHFMKTKNYGDLFKRFVNTMIEHRNAQMINEQAMTSTQSLQGTSEGLGLNSEDQDQKQDSQQTTSSKSDMNKVGEDRSKKDVTAEVYCEPKKEQNELSGQSSLSKSSDQADAQLYLQQANTEISILKAQKQALEVRNGTVAGELNRRLDIGRDLTAVKVKNVSLEAEVEMLREKVKDLAAIEAKNVGLEAQVESLREKVKDLAAIEAKNAGLEAQVQLLIKENQALSDKEAAALMCMAEAIV